MPASQAIQAIESYIRKCGQDHSQWCIGIAADPVAWMLNTHRVAEEGDGCGWISYRCADPEQARQTRDELIALGMNAAAGDGDPTATSVYVFKITGTTKP
jgi:hypothetical protein